MNSQNSSTDVFNLWFPLCLRRLDKNNQATDAWAQISMRRSVRGHLNTIQALKMFRIYLSVIIFSCLSHLETSESLNSSSKSSFTANENVSLLKSSQKERICRRRNNLDVVFYTRCFCRERRVNVFIIVTILQFSLQRLLVSFLPPAANILHVITACDHHVFCWRDFVHYNISVAESEAERDAATRQAAEETNPRRQLNQHQLLITVT